MFKYKTGDEVIITAGRDKGKKSKIERVLPKENKVIVTGVNLYKRHRKATRAQAAGIYEVIRPINVANIALICPKCSKTTRIGFQIDGKLKNRICKKCKGRLNIKKIES
ncbi:50S ribosomal protein L24 [Candidatus Curtissbacteria bacterium RBG_13_35_7]|uniref:Large ribosomal subunit protein uL24 n=1 Tax=Candidatus Curtissbacteria bacterium RBG_13_35_7 TaxID=1797705 RepID=A0A1F5G0T8_9BACT|nr:MAG: 50S ribosomal protein L24 [Candidatus Curtissbacteria bacterium RBG_13_35_7]